MCGIVGIVGKSDICSQIIETLKCLEYRGYDSAGIGIIDKIGDMHVRKAEGKLINLINKLEKDPILQSPTPHMNSSDFLCGIGHTRWATHGAANEVNAHPIYTDNVAVVHNGIVENYLSIKSELEANGIEFQSQTDTEVIAKLLDFYIKKNLSIEESMKRTLEKIEGAFAFLAIFKKHNGLIIAARKKNPLILGFGKDCIALCSDSTALCKICSEITFLEDGDFVKIYENQSTIFDKNGDIVLRQRTFLELNSEAISKGHYKHFMLKEIFEQPKTIKDTIDSVRFDIDFSKLLETAHIESAHKIIIIACGTSYYAAMVGKYWIEKELHIAVEVDIASEYRYRNPLINDGDVIIFISQSGETSDTLSVLEYIKSKSKNCKTIGIVNVKNSALARGVDFPIYTKVGAEIGVASTKAFTAQLATLAVIAFKKNSEAFDKFSLLPNLIKSVLDAEGKIKDIANKICNYTSVLYLARGNMYPIALEGALKLKELSYIHAEGIAAGEIKHGPIALIDDQVPIIFLLQSGSLFEKTLSNIQEVLSRGKNVFVFTDQQGAKYLRDDVDKCILPECDWTLSPMVYSVALQLLAYYTAYSLNRDIDQPRNLAKSVTVE